MLRKVSKLGDEGLKLTCGARARSVETREIVRALGKWTVEVDRIGNVAIATGFFGADEGTLYAGGAHWKGYCPADRGHKHAGWQ